MCPIVSLLQSVSNYCCSSSTPRVIKSLNAMDRGCMQFRSSKPLSDYIYGMNIVEKTTSQPNLASVTEIGIAVRLRELLIFAQPDALFITLVIESAKIRHQCDFPRARMEVQMWTAVPIAKPRSARAYTAKISDG